ncbi:MAG: hypothetical protein LBK26_03360 [Rickettsiales bacterium]|jgi:hypothetical protein|nr:hypothetical protein [Rickettsiales bacterium]
MPEFSNFEKMMNISILNSLPKSFGIDSFANYALSCRSKLPKKLPDSRTKIFNYKHEEIVDIESFYPARPLYYADYHNKPRPLTVSIERMRAKDSDYKIEFNGAFATFAQSAEIHGDFLYMIWADQFHRIEIRPESIAGQKQQIFDFLKDKEQISTAQEWYIFKAFAIIKYLEAAYSLSGAKLQNFQNDRAKELDLHKPMTDAEVAAALQKIMTNPKPIPTPAARLEKLRSEIAKLDIQYR